MFYRKQNKTKNISDFLLFWGSKRQHFDLGLADVKEGPIHRAEKIPSCVEKHQYYALELLLILP